MLRKKHFTGLRVKKPNEMGCKNGCDGWGRNVFCGMMVLDIPRYDYFVCASGREYFFESVGHRGLIQKIAFFDAISNHVYNLGFGDLDEETGEVSDTVVSGNGDAERVLGTLAHIIHDFTGRHPEAVVFIKGSDAIRTRWYQMHIRSHWETINTVFDVCGFRNNRWEPFTNGKNYEAFIARRKKTFFFWGRVHTYQGEII